MFSGESFALPCSVPPSGGRGHPSSLPRKRQRKREMAPFNYREVGRKLRGGRKSFISKPKAFQMRLRFQFNNWSTAFSSQIKIGKCVMKINCIFCIWKYSCLLTPHSQNFFDIDLGIFTSDACLVGLIFSGCKVPISGCKEIPSASLVHFHPSLQQCNSFGLLQLSLIVVPLLAEDD